MAPAAAVLKVHALIDAGTLAEAEPKIARLVQAYPNDADLQFLRRQLAHRKGDDRTAAGHFENAIALRPDLVAAHVELAKLYLTWREPARAQACYQAALEFAPDVAELHNNLGLALSELGAHAQALAQLEDCHRMAPGCTETICGLGKTSFELRWLARARQYFREALRLDAESADAHFGLANIALLEGDLAAGWDEYEWRTRMPRFAQYYHTPEPRWNGERLRGKTLLVNAEQGYGDVLMFARFLPRIRESGATGRKSVAYASTRTDPGAG